MKNLSTLIVSAALFLATPAYAQSQAASNVSALSAFGSIVVVYGSVAALANAGGAVVASVEKVGEVTTIVLKDASGAASTAIAISGDVAQGAALVAGTAVSVSATATGHILIAAGKVLAFIPNEAGKALLHSSSTAMPVK